jgi:hypothetical protein
MKQATITALALAPLLLAACDLVAPAQQRDRIDRIAIVPTTPVSPPQPPTLDAETQASYEAILAQVTSSGDLFFTRRAPTKVLNEVELVFFSLGRGPELLRRIEAAMIADPKARAWLLPRQAWLLGRLGQFDEARSVAEAARTDFPTEPDAWFVWAFANSQSASGSRVPVTALRDAINHLLAMAPDYFGPGDTTAEGLRKQLTTPATPSPHGGP